MRTGFFGLVLTAIALGVSPGLAQNSEEVKVVFEHAIPNIEGKRMVAQIVSYPPGGKSLPHRHAPSAFIYARVLSGAIRSQVGDEPVKVYQVGEAGTSYPARTTRSARMRVTGTLRAYWLSSSSIPATIPCLYQTRSRDRCKWPDDSVRSMSRASAASFIRPMKTRLIHQ
jgi:mannose-6-phosphate isomerase-like protein (cupin superfamily)